MELDRQIEDGEPLRHLETSLCGAKMSIFHARKNLTPFVNLALKLKEPDFRRVMSRKSILLEPEYDQAVQDNPFCATIPS